MALQVATYRIWDNLLVEYSFPMSPTLVHCASYNLVYLYLTAIEVCK